MIYVAKEKVIDTISLDLKMQSIHGYLNLHNILLKVKFSDILLLLLNTLFLTVQD